ncbi:MAG: hypothetical protein O7F75_08040 [Alphaproteobacteria bacterium]|nr:hypothetical protein [Alphaproteobacteria bacterium]
MKRLLLLSTLAFTLAMGAPAFAQDPPPPNAGAFAALSPGGQKIVNSIYDSQFDSANHLAMGTLLTTNDIAAMKADTGWGNVYKQLYDQGLVTHRNLGQAISSYNHQNKPSTTTVVTTGTGQQIVTGDQTGKGGNANSRGGGNKFGHFKDSGITTGAGGPSFGAGGSSFGAGGSKGRGRGGPSHKGK